MTTMQKLGNRGYEELDEKELVQANEAMHVILTVALARLGGSISVNEQDYLTAVHSGFAFDGHGGLQISRQKGVYYAALLNMEPNETPT